MSEHPNQYVVRIYLGDDKWETILSVIPNDLNAPADVLPLRVVQKAKQASKPYFLVQIAVYSEGRRAGAGTKPDMLYHLFGGINIPAGRVAHIEQEIDHPTNGVSLRMPNQKAAQTFPWTELDIHNMVVESRHQLAKIHDHMETNSSGDPITLNQGNIVKFLDDEANKIIGAQQFIRSGKFKRPAGFLFDAVNAFQGAAHAALSIGGGQDFNTNERHYGNMIRAWKEATNALVAAQQAIGMLDVPAQSKSLATPQQALTNAARKTIVRKRIRVKADAFSQGQVDTANGALTASFLPKLLNVSQNVDQYLIPDFESRSPLAHGAVVLQVCKDYLPIFAEDVYDIGDQKAIQLLKITERLLKTAKDGWRPFDNTLAIMNKGRHDLKMAMIAFLQLFERIRTIANARVPTTPSLASHLEDKLRTMLSQRGHNWIPSADLKKVFGLSEHWIADLLHHNYLIPSRDYTQYRVSDKL